MKPLIITLIYTFLPFVQGEVLVTKSNGDVMRLSNITIVQASSLKSSKELTYRHNGTVNTVSLSSIKRLNLKSLASKRKGVSIWDALLVLKSGVKMEVKVRLDRIEGTSGSGQSVSISFGMIDKLSF